MKEIRMPLEEYEKEVAFARMGGIQAGICKEQERLKPLINFLWNLTEMKVHPDGKEDLIYLETNKDANFEHTILKLRFLMKQVGEFT